MKDRIRNYLDPALKWVTPNDVHYAITEMMANDIEIIQMDKEEFKAFCSMYDTVLPWDWDRKTFRGITIERI